MAREVPLWERGDWPQQVATLTLEEKRELETLLKLRPGIVDDPGELRQAFRDLVRVLGAILDVFNHPAEVAAEAILLQGRVAKAALN